MLRGADDGSYIDVASSEMGNYVLIPYRRVGIVGTVTTTEMAPWLDPTYHPVCLGNLFVV
jgi:hypothetical protein